MRSPLFSGYLAEFMKSEASNLTDAVLVSREDDKFPVHRVLLASGSNFFKQLFLFDKNNVGDVGNEFKITGSSSNELGPIIHWFYSDQLDINEDNVFELLEAAEFLSVSGVSDLCQKWLTESLTKDSVLNVWRYAEEHLLENLSKEVLEYLLEHLEYVIEMEEFLELEKDVVEKILSNDHVACGEHVVWKGLVRWLEHDHSRMSGNILSIIRLDLLDPYFYHQEISPYLKRLSNCTTTITTFKKDAESHLSMMFNLPEQKRTCEAFLRGPGSFVFILGWHIDRIGSDYGIRLYNPLCHTWRQLSIKLPFGWTGKELVNNRTDVYLTGSSLVEMPENVLSQAFFRLNLKTMMIKRLENMPRFKERASLAILDDKVYIIGGLKKPWKSNPYEAHRTVDIYECSTNTWSTGPFMIEKRSDASSAFTKDSIFIMGGYNSKEKALATCEVFENDSWHQLPSMATARSEARSVALEGRVYVVGGKNEKFDRNGLKSGEVLDKKRERWRSLPDMNTPRYNHTLVVLNRKIHAIGGNITADRITGSVEVLEEEGWVTAGTLPMGLSMLSSVVVSARELEAGTILPLFSCDHNEGLNKSMYNLAKCIASNVLYSQNIPSSH